MQRKVPKNPDADHPTGRLDWEGRIPRWKGYLTEPQVRILIEVFEVTFDQKPDWRLDPKYFELYEKLLALRDQYFPALLTTTVEEFPMDVVGGFDFG